MKKRVQSKHLSPVVAKRRHNRLNKIYLYHCLAYLHTTPMHFI